VIKKTHNNFRWQLADDFAPLLVDLWRADPVEVVKDDRAKFVARYEVNGRAFYVKRYRHGSFALRPAKFVVKRSQARHEWQLAGELEKRGVRVVRHLALGERWSARGLMESVLITEAFDGVPLEPRHEKFFSRVMEFVGEMAQARVSHSDFHPANLLLNEATGEIRLIDLYGGKICDDEPSSKIRDFLLTQLCISLPLPVGTEVTRASQALRKQKLAERARRSLKSNRDFARKRFGKFSWQVRRAAITPEVESVLRDPDGFIRRARVLKAGHSSTVALAHGLVLKRHNFKKPLNLGKDFVRGSRGRRDFLKAYHLELCGLATARVIATADHRVLGASPRSFVLMEEIPSAINAGQAGEKEMVKMAQLIARLHENGFTHRDLKRTNILFNAEGVAHLIDLDGLKFVENITPLEAAANLRRLAEGLGTAGKLTRRNVVLFMLNYCRVRGIFPRTLFPRTKT
jgi:tRNA A-37 threonylcarbamoyl transferase component Bud32